MTEMRGVIVLSAPHHSEPVDGVWTQVVHGDGGHVDADLMYADRLPVGVQSALSLVPRHTANTAELNERSPGTVSRS